MEREDTLYIISKLSEVASDHPEASKDLREIIEMMRGIESGAYTPDYYALMDAVDTYGG